jgi:hypothetical protein
MVGKSPLANKTGSYRLPTHLLVGLLGSHNP